MIVWYGDLIGKPAFIYDKEVEEELKARLLSVINSPAELPFFEAYWAATEGASKTSALALLPQVWALYDPKSADQRGGASYFAHQRMDFLMFPPQGARVVLEIDGKQHYANGDIASPSLYAKMVEADRDMRLRGYEVHRFGGAETNDATKASRLVQTFIPRLFRKHGVEMT